MPSAWGQIKTLLSSLCRSIASGSFPPGRCRSGLPAPLFPRCLRRLRQKWAGTLREHPCPLRFLRASAAAMTAFGNPILRSSTYFFALRIRPTTHNCPQQLRASATGHACAWLGKNNFLTDNCFAEGNPSRIPPVASPRNKNITTTFYPSSIIRSELLCRYEHVTTPHTPLSTILEATGKPSKSLFANRLHISPVIVELLIDNRTAKTSPNSKSLSD